MSKIFSVVIAMILAIPSLAVAGPYIGLGMGIGRTESTLTKLDLVPDPILESDLPVFGTSQSFSSSEANYEVTAGWNFNRHFGVEVGYTKFGEANDNYELPLACNELGCQSRQWTAEMKMKGFRAFLVGSLPLSDRVDAYAKVGAMRWDADYDGFERNANIVPDPDPPGPIGERNGPVSYDDDGTDLAVGLGLNLKTDSPISLHLDFTYYAVDTTDYVYDIALLAIYNF
jgi:hypothetical protein